MGIEAGTIMAVKEVTDSEISIYPINRQPETFSMSLNFRLYPKDEYFAIIDELTNQDLALLRTQLQREAVENLEDFINGLENDRSLNRFLQAY